MFTIASMLSRNIACVFSPMPARSNGFSIDGGRRSRLALRAMLTARSPIRSRSLLIFNAATMNRRSIATG